MQWNITALTLFIVVNDYGVVGTELINLHKFLPGADNLIFNIYWQIKVFFEKNVKTWNKNI